MIKRDQNLVDIFVSWSFKKDGRKKNTMIIYLRSYLTLFLILYGISVIDYLGSSALGS